MWTVLELNANGTIRQTYSVDIELEVYEMTEKSMEGIIGRKLTQEEKMTFALEHHIEIDGRVLSYCAHFRE
jgi:hypothetical protein